MSGFEIRTQVMDGAASYSEVTVDGISMKTIEATGTLKLVSVKFWLGGIGESGLQDVTGKFWRQLVETFAFFNSAREDIEKKYKTEARRIAAKVQLFNETLGYGKQFDIKVLGKAFHHSEIGFESIFEGEVYSWADYGNTNYGYAAKVLGLSLELVTAAAGIAQVIKR